MSSADGCARLLMPRLLLEVWETKLEPGLLRSCRRSRSSRRPRLHYSSTRGTERQPGELPGHRLKLKESKAVLEAHFDKLAPQWAPSSVGRSCRGVWCDIATNGVAGALRARLGACVGAISQDALGAYRVECPRDSFTATMRLQTSNGRVARAWVTTVRAGERRSPASSYDFWRRVGDEATEAADECIKKARGSTLGVVARLLVAVAKARDDASASTAAARHKASVARSAPRVPDCAGGSVVGAGGGRGLAP